MDIAATPAPGHADSYVHWQDVLVTLPHSNGRTARVLGMAPDGRSLTVQPGSVDPSSGAWAAEAGAAEAAVDPLSLGVVPPTKKDRVKILGEQEGLSAPPGTVGTLIGIDSMDGIVRVDNQTELLIVDMGMLGKLVAG